MPVKLNAFETTCVSQTLVSNDLRTVVFTKQEIVDFLKATAWDYPVPAAQAVWEKLKQAVDSEDLIFRR